MLLFAVISMAMLPVLITGMKQSVSNTTQATATQMANDRIQVAQSKGPSCSDVSAVAGVLSLTDPQGVPLQSTTVVDSCPAGTGTVSVSVVVVRLDTNHALATAKTLVFVR